jgi:hypothetical protein
MYKKRGIGDRCPFTVDRSSKAIDLKEKPPDLGGFYNIRLMFIRTTVNG